MQTIEGIKLFTIAEIADALQLHVRTVQLYCKKGKLKAQTIGGRKMISEENFKKFLQGE